MIFHFLNLTCWRDVFADDGASTDVYVVDSRSLQFLLRMFGYKVGRRPGVEFVSRFREADVFFLTARPLVTVAVEKQLELPPLTAGDLKEYARTLDGYATDCANIVIGISSPKQNILARCAFKGSRCKVYCLGAAVSDEYLAHEWTGRVNRPHWISMLVRNPRRGVAKISSTVLEAILILLVPKMRRKFRAFGERVSADSLKSLL